MEQFSQFVVHHWGFWLAFIIVSILILINELYSQKNNAKSLSPQAAIDLLNNEHGVIIDLRDMESFKKGHIIDAIHATADDFKQQRMEKYKAKPLILVCAKGLQSATLATELRKKGFEHCMFLSGGLAAWQAASLPLVKGK